MNQADFLKIAYLHGIAKAAGESSLTEEECDVLFKHAAPSMRGYAKVRGIFQRGAPAAEKMVTKKAPGAMVPKPTVAPAAPQMPAKPKYQDPGRIKGEGFSARRGRVGVAKETHRTNVATPKLVSKQKAQTSRELAKARGQAQKEHIQRQSQAALAQEQQTLRAAQAEQQAAVGAEKMPSRKAAPATSASKETVTKTTEKAKETAQAGADQSAMGAAGGTAKGEVKALEGAEAAGQTGAKAEENLAKRYEESRAAMPGAGRKQLAEVEQAGATGALGTMGATVAPAALGAGVGYAADGREGALVGAGLGLGARAGMGPVLKRLREARGFQQMLGRSAGAAPTMSKYMATPVGRKSLVGAGIAGAGGAGLGYAAGQQLPPEEPEHWYSGMGFGLSPEMMQGVGQTALPYLADKYNIDPSAMQRFGSQYGLVPPQMQQRMPY